MEQDFNPYRPPAANVQPAAEEPTGSDTPLEVAGRGRRFLTWVVDYIGFMVACVILGVVMGLMGAAGALKAANEGAWAYLFGFVLLSSYYLFFEGLWGRTPGKLLLGTKVVTLTGGTPTFGAIAGRTLARFVPFEGLTFFGERGFHDRVSSTKVVRVR